MGERKGLLQRHSREPRRGTHRVQQRCRWRTPADERHLARLDSLKPGVGQTRAGGKSSKTIQDVATASCLFHFWSGNPPNLQVSLCPAHSLSAIAVALVCFCGSQSSWPGAQCSRAPGTPKGQLGTPARPIPWRHRAGASQPSDFQVRKHPSTTRGFSSVGGLRLVILSSTECGPIPSRSSPDCSPAPSGR